MMALIEALADGASLEAALVSWTASARPAHSEESAAEAATTNLGEWFREWTRRGYFSAIQLA